MTALSHRGTGQMPAESCRTAIRWPSVRSSQPDARSCVIAKDPGPSLLTDSAFCGVDVSREILGVRIDLGLRREARRTDLLVT